MLPAILQFFLSRTKNEREREIVREKKREIVRAIFFLLFLKCKRCKKLCIEDVVASSYFKSNVLAYFYVFVDFDVDAVVDVVVVDVDVVVYAYVDLDLDVNVAAVVGGGVDDVVTVLIVHATVNVVVSKNLSDLGILLH